jgi:hypothetical protein
MARTWSFAAFTVAASLIVLAVFCIVYAGFVDPWRNIGALFIAMAGYGLAMLGITVMVVSAIASSRRLPWIVGILLSCAAVGIAQYADNAIAQVFRESEVRKALDAGLENDCRILFAEYQADPRLEEGGYIRIFRNSDEFNTLPASIRMLHPIYVTIEAHRSGSGMPANIGLCKNGFGGFAFGVRVFVDGENVPETFWSQQITSTVYLWQEET